MRNELRFEASAKLQRLFGRDLLPDDYSAIEELVKNAYDSNATEVVITVVRDSGNHGGEIEIRDNGSGLTLKGFRRVWMWAGYSEKTAQPLPVTGRVPVGEKGIGRFAADKLGEELTVITKCKGVGQALRVVFDWKLFGDQRKRLSDIAIPYEYVREPLLRRDQSGTILRIEKLRSNWDDRSIERLRRRLAQLLNPYDDAQVFRIAVKAPRPKLSGPVIPTPIRNADFEWEVIRLAKGRTTIRRRARQIVDGVSTWSEWEGLPPSGETKLDGNHEFGPLRARLFYFINRPKRVDVGEATPGVGVYRDGLRVEPAGSSAADWLGLLEKRAKRAGHMPLVPSRLFGFVEIRREANPKLQDATNRRAFIAGPALNAFTDFLKRRLQELEIAVEKEVAEPRWERSRQVRAQKLIQARYQTLSFLSLGLAHELRQPLQAIHTASANIADHLESAGINIPQVGSAVDVIKRNVERIEKHIRFLKEIGSGREEVEEVKVDDVIGEVVEAFREQAAARNIKFARNGPMPVTARFNRSVLLTTLTNLVMNAFQALEESSGLAEYHIEIRVEQGQGVVKIVVEDDGPGIPEEARHRLFKRPTTNKKGGMGVALILWKDALKMFGGDLECGSYVDPTRFVITLPIEVEGGAHPSS